MKLYLCGSSAEAVAEKLLNGSPRMKLGNGPARMHWPFAYNIEIFPKRYSLEKIKQKSTESYREFAYRWRKEAARVRPPMCEKEIV